MIESGFIDILCRVEYRRGKIALLQHKIDLNEFTKLREVMLLRKFLKYWLPVIIWMGVIIWVSTGIFSYECTYRFIIPVLHFLFPWLSPESVNMLHELIRKSARITMYIILGLLLVRASVVVLRKKGC